MATGDQVIILHPASSFKGCLGTLVQPHEKFKDYWWVEIDGWKPMVFPEAALLKL